MIEISIGNERGMSLTSALVAIAIMAVISLGMMTTMDNMSQSQNMIEYRAQAAVLEAEIRAHLANSGACLATFSGATLTPSVKTSISQIRNSDGTERYRTNTPYGDRHVSISDLAFEYISDTPSPPNTGLANLSIQMEAVRNVQGPKSLRPRTIALQVTKSGATLVGCVSLATGKDELWQQSAVNLNNIHYSAGNVGIGISDPQNKLDIGGSNSPIVQLKIANYGGPASVYTSIAGENYSNLGHFGFNSYRYRGPRPSPSAVMSSDILGAWSGWGFNGTSVTHPGAPDSAPVGIAFVASSNFTLANMRTHMTFVTSSGVPSGGLLGHERMRIDGDGRVGIGTSAPRTSLDIPNGQISAYFPGSAGAAGPVCYNGVTGIIDACSSLSKFKTKVRPLDIGLETLFKLKPVSYEWKDSGESEIGFIAEESAAVDSRFALTGTDRKLVGLKYEKLSSLIVHAIQQFYAEFNSTREELKVLRLENEKLRTRLDEIEKRTSR